MGKKVLIAYADDNMAYSLRRIGKQARNLGIFDDVVLWTPNDLPEYIQSSPLMKYKYGGGYWAWKPCVIHETLQRYEEGTVICYVDAGCTLDNGNEWILWTEIMKEYDTLLFKYRDEMPCWDKFGSVSTKIKHWTKKNSILFYDRMTGGEDWRDLNKIWGGCLFVKGKKNQFVRKWLDIVINNPEVIIDPSEEECKDQYFFFALHKHDQSLLTALSYLYHNECIVLPELSETCGPEVAVYASRIRAKSFLDYIIFKMKMCARSILGNNLYEKIKGGIK